MLRDRARAALLAGTQGLVLSVLSTGVSLSLFIVTVLSLSFILLGIGLFTTPAVLALVRAHANQRRLFARDWSQVIIPPQYRPLPPGQHQGMRGQAKQTFHLLRDPGTWRDIQWLIADAVAGSLTALLPPTLLAYGLFGPVLAAGVWRPIHNSGGTFWYAFIPVTSQFTAQLAALLGILLLGIALLCNPTVVRLHFLAARALLGASQKQALAQRVERLQETRHDAVDSSAAELRRIERDLHDGAQARLVAMGMSLGTIEALIEKDPAQAKRLLAQARENSAEALTELRDLVRGIHPPVLAERGLPDAARALALRMQIPVDVEVDLPGRLEEPVESAAYFAISEVLTNAAKHARAKRVWLDIYYGRKDRMLRIAVTDNGRGGASPDRGTGLSGIERRLGAFDGILAVSSPAGGPTLVTIEIPCTFTATGDPIH